MHRKSATELKHRDFAFDIKAVEKDGFFAGYGSVFGVLDSYREIVAAGAFTECLATRAAKGRKLPILWQHRTGEPMGIYDKVQEDKTGLYVEGHLLIEDVARAKEAHALMKAGAVTGLSIGYYVTDDSWNEKERVRTLKAVDLQEVSVVTFPANDEARVEVVKGIKQIVCNGQLPEAPVFEDFLCEAGFSRSQAKFFAAKLLQLRENDRREVEGSEVVQLLKEWRISA